MSKQKELAYGSDSQWVNSDLETACIGHLGLVAATMEKLDFMGMADKFLQGKRECQRVSMGQRLGAMTLHLMSFMNRTMYRTAEFLEGFAFEALLGKDAPSDAFNDDALGRLLDEIFEYGPAKFFQAMSIAMISDKKLGGSSLRLDSTSMSLEGMYADSEGNTPPDGVRITFGYSKDGRRDLRQVVLALVTTGPANLPVVAAPLDGNASDKTEFRKIIKEFQENIVAPSQPLWVFDSAGYNKSWLEAQRDNEVGFIPWLTRVPESIKKAKTVVEGDYDERDWEEIGNGYKAIEMKKTYGGIKQLWALYYSQKAYDREVLTVEKKIKKEHDRVATSLWHLSNQEFSCQEDARKAVEKCLKKAKFHNFADCSFEEVKKYSRRGRPSKEVKTTSVVVKVNGLVREDIEAINKAKRCCGRFILATNLISKQSLLEDAKSKTLADMTTGSDDIQHSRGHEGLVQTRSQLILKTYKELHGVESAFKMLKDKEFMMNRFFLHKESRIESLIVVFALAIFIYNYAQHFIVDRINKSAIKVPGPGGTKLKNVTLKRVFEVFRTVSAFKDTNITDGRYMISKLRTIQIDILRALGPPYMRMHGII